MFVSIIISTYNSPIWLEKVLNGYIAQSIKSFEIIIADDGSDDETKKVINNYRDQYLSIQHIWHEDKGFRKCEILNKAIIQANSDYLIFTDGDCIPREDFIEMHLKHREKGHFLSGGYFKLPMQLSIAIQKQDILNQNCFSLPWLKRNGLKRSFKNNKLGSYKLLTHILNLITPTKPSWNGHNSSGWKDDILAVNGFDERMKYGGEDRELGERLENSGINGKQIRYKAICVHLDHSRSYVNAEDWQRNNSIRQETKSNRAIWTKFGIKKEL